MAHVKILADSTCDLTPALLRQYDITLTPLSVIKDGKDFHDGVDITPADIFAHVDAGGKLCSTAAVSEYEYTQMFSRFAPEYDTVLQITIGSGFSACYQNACLAAQSFPNVIVIDSENLSTGQGLLVIAAARLAEQGLSGAQIAEQVRALVPKVEASFLVERLDYLYKGGRCSAVAALGANMLKLKPCIEVKDGKMGVCKKYRGTFESCVRAYIADRLNGQNNLDLRRVFITHSGVPENIIETAKKAVREYQNFEEICVTRAGCTVSSHCGPGTIGVLFIHER